MKQFPSAAGEGNKFICWPFQEGVGMKKEMRLQDFPSFRSLNDISVKTVANQ